MKFKGACNFFKKVTVPTLCISHSSQTNPPPSPRHVGDNKKRYDVDPPLPYEIFSWAHNSSQKTTVRLGESSTFLRCDPGNGPLWRRFVDVVGKCARADTTQSPALWRWIGQLSLFFGWEVEVSLSYVD